MSKTGVYPIYENKFKIGTTFGATTATVEIADLESFAVTLDNGIEEWSPLDTAGWKRRRLTAKAMTIALTGKRHIGDPGNDFIASLALASGEECVIPVEWELPTGEKYAFTGVVNVTNPGGGDSTALAPLEFEIQSDGIVTRTPAPTV